MMQPAIAMQEEHEVFLFIADYHALTSVEDADFLRQATRDVALDFLACGLDPERTVFYRQSDLPEVCELTWILSNLIKVERLELAHSYKDKVARGIKGNAGLFTYPVLMASDILIVQSDLVPVGQDQKQHLEMTRDMAGRFNHVFGETFKLPEPMIRSDVAKVPGIDGEKMSKSLSNTIPIFGEPKPLRKRMMKIVTDSTSLEEPKDPETCNVFALYKLFADGAEQAALAERYRAGGMGYGEAKQALFEKHEERFGPMRERRAELAADPATVDRILANGAERARVVMQETLQAARKAVGLA